MADSAVLKVVVCGGGNGAHVASGLFSQNPNVEVRVLTLYADEAERWSDCLKQKGYLAVERKNIDGSVSILKARPSLVTKDPVLAVAGCDVVILTVPAFAHDQYLKAVIPQLKPRSIIAGVPGQAGFEFQCWDLLKEKVHTCAVVSFETLPWACRLVEFGKEVRILGTKESICASVIGRNNSHLPPLPTMQDLIGKSPVIQEVSNYLEITFLGKSIVHPPLMYATWNDWDGTPQDDMPLLYAGVSEYGAKLCEAINDEARQTAKVLSQHRTDVDLTKLGSVLDWLKCHYGDQIKDSSSLMTAMRTNDALKDIKHPMKKTKDGKFIPDFHNRYLAEDVPYGVVVFRGMAEIAGVKTPAMDEILLWSQKILGKEYLVGGELKGKDIRDTRAPQRYGFRTLTDLFRLL